MAVRKILVEKKPGFDVQAKNYLADLKTNFGISCIENLRLINRYFVEGLSAEKLDSAMVTIFSEPPQDRLLPDLDFKADEKAFCFEYLPGQYDQRADSAEQAIRLIAPNESFRVRTAKIILLKGRISKDDLKKIQDYFINPVDSRLASFEIPLTLEGEDATVGDSIVLDGFIEIKEEDIEEYLNKYKLAMDCDDLKFMRDYFRDKEKRNPSIVELKIIDTYWSDHCRHTTFSTNIEDVQFAEGPFCSVISGAFREYLEDKESLGRKDKRVCLMGIATQGARLLKQRGLLEDLDESEEINACSIRRQVDVDGVKNDYLIMFKNETHNHPTEIEPFGGAATCLGGAIRDPLSGRSYVYQAMRVTGSGDPRLKNPLPGKLPQRKITQGAASGYSSYGNQIGLATGIVDEFYDEGYRAKRLEIGAVIGAVPASNVRRERPAPGDRVILLGGKTGRDGCGGATGSSKAHDEESLVKSGAEVQKGNPPEERKIQRLFRKKEVSLMIKRCNDFGAGGVSVAIGELADGLIIDLDRVPKKYEGLDATELAISESQERMAVVVSPEDLERFIQEAEKENLQATEVALVVSEKRVKMLHKGAEVVNISREFLDSFGAEKKVDIKITEPEQKSNPFRILPEELGNSESTREAWLKNLERLNCCSKKGLQERFDSSIGASTVLMPFGGRYQLSPIESMVAKIPLLSGETDSATAMSFGFNPDISKWSPFHGAVYALVESLSRLLCSGVDPREARLSLQEFFPKPLKNPEKWGLPLSALLGAYVAQKNLGTAAIGGKDSMSGTFEDLEVPPTLVSFAVNMTDAGSVISPEFKRSGSLVLLFNIKMNNEEIPDFEYLKNLYASIYGLMQEKLVLSASSVRTGGVSQALSRMCFGNKIGFQFAGPASAEKLFAPLVGSILIEINKENLGRIPDSLNFEVLGDTRQEAIIEVNGEKISLQDAIDSYMSPLESIFPLNVPSEKGVIEKFSYSLGKPGKSSIRHASPRVFIPVFPGTNCEYDSRRAFERAGAIVNEFVFRNSSSSQIEGSIEELVKSIKNSQILMIPGGFSAGDEPEGSGKFIAAVFRNSAVRDAVSELLEERDGLILGICNGFQALIKLGLLPGGRISDLTEQSPTLTFNNIGRHQALMVRTKIVSNLSPWFIEHQLGEIHQIAVSHGEGRFFSTPEVLQSLKESGQIATEYVDLQGNPTYDIRYNPNGSALAIEGITSPDGRILGKMGHSERCGLNVAKNIEGDKEQKIFSSGVSYFK